MTGPIIIQNQGNTFWDLNNKKYLNFSMIVGLDRLFK